MKRGAALLTVAAMAGGAAVPLLPRGASATIACNQPQVTSLSQQHGPAGATLTINGSGFSPGICSLSVNIGPYSVPSPTTNGSQITFTTAAGWSGQVAVTLTSGGASNTDNHLIYVTDPSVSGLDNATPTTGSTFHMQGQGFNFNLPSGWESATASYASTSGSGCVGASSSAGIASAQITLVAPSAYCDGRVTVSLSAPVDTSNTSRMTIPVSAPFDIAPNVTSPPPSSATPGQTITIGGSGFGQSGTVVVGGVQDSSVQWTDTALHIVVPSNATSGSLTVTRPDGVSVYSGSLGVNATVTSVSPSQAAVGDTVTVSGAGFGAQSSSSGVSIGGVAATVQQWSPSTIVFAVPDGVAPGGTGITITTSGTNPPPAPAFTVIPRITGTTPAHAAPGAVVEIDGTSFGTQQGMVQAGGQDATIMVWGDKSVVVSLPAAIAQGSTTISLTPVGTSYAASTPFSVDAPSKASSSTGGGSTAGSGGSAGHTTAVPGTPGAQVTSTGLILPSASGPIIAHGPVQFTKPAPPPGPVQLKLDTPAAQGDPGASVPFTVTLTAFNKPVVGAPVDLQLVIEPGSDATLNPAHGVTDANGQVKGTIHLSRTAGDHIVLARSGIYSDEVRVVGRSANTTVSAGPAGGVADSSPVSSLVSVRSPVLWALIACVLLFGAGFGLNLVTAPAPAGGGSGAAPGSRRDAREALLASARAAGSALRFGAGVAAVLGASALGALRRR